MSLNNWQHECMIKNKTISIVMFFLLLCEKANIKCQIRRYSHKHYVSNNMTSDFIDLTKNVNVIKSEIQENKMVVTMFVTDLQRH